MSRGQVCSVCPAPWTCSQGPVGECVNCVTCCRERQGRRCRAWGWCRVLRNLQPHFPSSYFQPLIPVLCPGLPSWLRWGLWPRASPSVPRALGGVCQGAAGTQRRAGRGGIQRHAELRGGPGPDGGDVVQGRQEAEFELESACGGLGPWAAAGGAAGGQGGYRGVQLRGRGPEGLLPPGRHRSVLEEDAELAWVQVLRGLAPASPDYVCTCLDPPSLHAFQSSMSHLGAHFGPGEGVHGEKRGVLVHAFSGSEAQSHCLNTCSWSACCFWCGDPASPWCLGAEVGLGITDLPPIISFLRASIGLHPIPLAGLGWPELRFDGSPFRRHIDHTVLLGILLGMKFGWWNLRFLGSPSLLFLLWLSIGSQNRPMLCCQVLAKGRKKGWLVEHPVCHLGWSWIAKHYFAFVFKQVGCCRLYSPWCDAGEFRNWKEKVTSATSLGFANEELLSY